MKESAIKFAKDNKLLFIDESSALADINIREVVEELLENIFRVQTYLINKGIKPPNALKLVDEDFANTSAHRCCY